MRYVLPVISVFSVLILLHGVYALSETAHSRTKTPVGQHKVTFASGNSHTYFIYRDNMPLTIEDLLDIDFDYYSYEWDESSEFLLWEGTGIQRGYQADGTEMPYLSYKVTEVKWTLFYDLCRKEYLTRYDRFVVDLDDEAGESEDAQTEATDVVSKVYRQQDTTGILPETITVYRAYYTENPSLHYLICGNDHIVDMTAGWELTPEQLQIIVEKLMK